MHKELTVVIMDPAIGSTNLGNDIIAEAVNGVINRILPNTRVIRISSYDVGLWAGTVIRQADYVILGGSNALSANPIFGYRQFAKGFLDIFRLRNVILLGVGWWQYQNGFGVFAKMFYRKFLKPDCIHSVRDQYTKDKLNKLGFDNVLNTSCPTMWNLHDFNTTIGNRAVVTITDYHRVKNRDYSILHNALAKFDKVFLWPQGAKDLEYLRSFGGELELHKVAVLPPTLVAFDRLLSEGICYVGTRLHAGIRALQFQCPAFIIAVDNRAVEIAKTEALTLVDAKLDLIKRGDNYIFVHKKRMEIDQFLRQFDPT